MNQSDIYQLWKPTVLGQKVDIDGAYGDQCVDVVDSYGEALFPGVSWATVFPPVRSAKDLGDKHNDQYFEWIENDHNDPNQLPQQGDILVCGATPTDGYSNTTDNPDGHTGVVDSCDSNGYTLLMQDGSHPDGSTYLQYRSWRFRPVLGWLRPRLSSTPSPAPAPAPDPAPTGKKLFLPSSVLKWRVYRVEGPWTIGNEVAFLRPSAFPPGLTYDIEDTLAANIYKITTENFGTVAIYAGDDTDAQIS